MDAVDINPGGAVWGGERGIGGRLGVPRVLLGRAAARGQHAGRRVADGRRIDGGRAPEEEVLSTESYTLDQFRAAGARKSIMDRLEALDARGIAITDDILGKIGVAAPNTNKRPDAPGTKRRSEACEMLTCIGDAHVEVMRNEKGVCDVDASASLQRVGVGADVGTDTRPRRRSSRWAWATACGWSSPRRRTWNGSSVNEEEAADEQALVRAAAWRAALRVGADDPPRSLSSVCGVAVAVQLWPLRRRFCRGRGGQGRQAARRCPGRPWTRRRAVRRGLVGAEGRGGGSRRGQVAVSMLHRIDQRRPMLAAGFTVLRLRAPACTASAVEDAARFRDLLGTASESRALARSISRSRRRDRSST